MMDSEKSTDPMPLPPLWQRLVFGRRPRVTLVRAAVLAAVSLFLFGIVLRPVRVLGESMTPAYRDRSVNFINRWAYLLHEPQRGDVVSVKITGEHIMYLKRIIALPGERFAILNGTVLINGEPIEERYVRNRARWNYKEVELGADEYMVIGDNRSMRQEDHSWGRVTRERIMGKVLW